MGFKLYVFNVFIFNIYIIKSNLCFIIFIINDIINNNKSNLRIKEFKIDMIFLCNFQLI